MKPMKSIALFFTLFSAFSFAQITISGKIKTKGGKALKDVSVTLKDTYDGATSDEKGNYSFQTTETGDKILVFSAPDFAEVEKKINIDGKNLTIDSQMKEKINEISAVVITAGAIEASDRKRATAILKPLDIYTTAGADAQITSALITLPGVQKVGESEGLFVRGGTGTESKIFFDGTLVNNYFTNSTPGIAGRERFNTSLFKGNVFSSGGYSALYGQALSSILVLESVDIPETSSYSFGVSPLFASANVQMVNKAKDRSYGVSASYSNLFLMTKLLKWETEFEKSPSGMSADFNYRFKTKNGGMFKYYGNVDANQSAVLRPTLELGYDKDGFAIKAENTFHNATWREKWGKYKLDANFSYAYNHNILDLSRNTGDIKQSSVVIDNTANYINAKLVLDRKINIISALRGGMETNISNETTQVFPFYTTPLTYKINNQLTSLFAETDLGFSNSLSVRLGIRGEYSSWLNQWNLAPRAAVTYRLSKEWLTSLAYGQYFQNPESRYLVNISNRDMLRYQSASHYILQVQRNSEGRNLRLEIFYKDYEKLMKTQWVNQQSVLKNIEGNGYAKGIELFWRDKKTFKNIDYWVSYSYLDSQRDFMNYPMSLFPNFAAKHTASLVAKKFVAEWKTGFNMSYTYTNGRPFYNIVNENSGYQLKSQGIIKDYSALNFSVNYLPNLGKKDAKAFTVLVLSINNVLGNKNIFGYNFSNDGLRSSPILPPAQTFVFVGVFISFGIDRTSDAINNNL
ncbi:MAG: TonB-dependent receptor [Cloacibacterium sp.]|jgi:hypothetical protein|nr:TonB-dependent receptor [Cloacibacterium sp.]